MDLATRSQKITPVTVDALSGRSPQILARIPRTSSHLPTATSLQLPVGDAAEQVLLVEGASAPPLPPPAPPSKTEGNTYFVDAGHDSAEHGSPKCASGAGCGSQQCRTGSSDASQSSLPEHKPKASSKQVSLQSTPSNTSQNNWAKKLSQLHAGLVPYSGLIVALALVTSASLLYWLTLKPAGTPTGHQEIFSASHWPNITSDVANDIPNNDLANNIANDESSEKISISEPTPAPETVTSLPESVLPEFPMLPNDLPSEALETETNPAQFVANTSSQETTAPELEKVVLPSQDTNHPVSEPSFPSTDFMSLDFSRIGVSPPEFSKHLPQNVQQTSPAVADRSLNAPSSPIRR